MLRLPWRSLAASFPLPSLQIPQRPLGELLRIVQRRLEPHDLGITRIAFVHHEASTDLLSTYCETGADGGPTGGDGEPGSSHPHFEPRALATVPSLGRLRDQQQARVLHDLERELDPTSDHSRWLLAQGWRASLTLPLLHHSRLLGFLFLDSTRAGAFDPRAMAALEPHLELLLLRISNHFSDLASLDGSLGQLLEIAELRDQETATHMERVSRYSRLIALQLETQRPLPADFSENLHRFAAFHDVGKLGIPDRILLKPEPLSREERLVMQSHVVIGMALVEKLITAMGLEDAPGIDLLRQVVAHHHESLDGSGYPAGLRGEEVSLAGRIVAVADIYDALTQARPYKPPFSEPHAVQMLRTMVQAGKLDGDCVDALLRSDDQRQAIRLGHAAGGAWEGNRPPEQAGVPYDPPIPLPG
jgi:HD-GYP domain-containing protein (c-di-GMP phosphodiesterase class II)